MFRMKPAQCLNARMFGVSVSSAEAQDLIQVLLVGFCVVLFAMGYGSGVQS